MTINYSKIDVVQSDLYYIGKGYAEQIDPRTPPKLILMMPVKQGEDDITKAFRLLFYQYENYWALYSMGLISKAPLEVVYQGCLYDRIASKGYQPDEAVERVADYFSDRHFHRAIEIERALASCNNPTFTSFASYIDRKMTEKSITRACFAARIIASTSRPSELSYKIDQRVAEIYRRCKDVAEEDDVILQSCRNCKME